MSGSSSKNYKYKHYFITNRFVFDNGKVDDSGKKPVQDDLRFGEYQFNNVKDKGDYQVLEEPPASELEVMYKHADNATRRRNLPSEVVFNALHRSMSRSGKGTGDVLFYIHGFNCSFHDSMKLIRVLHEKYVEDRQSPIKTIVAFCWPSNGKLREYREDAEDAVQSGRILGRLYTKLHAWFRRKHMNKNFRECEQHIHVMAHSMGNRVLEAMIGTLARKGVAPRAFFKQVVSVGADIDYDAYEVDKPMYNLIDYCDRIHVYFHDKDSALIISEETKNALRRLGRWGFKNSRRLPDNVYQCNVSDARDDDGSLDEKAFNHWYYYTSTSVVDDIIGVLKGSSSMYYE